MIIVLKTKLAPASPKLYPIFSRTGFFDYLDSLVILSWSFGKLSGQRQNEEHNSTKLLADSVWMFPKFHAALRAF